MNTTQRRGIAPPPHERWVGSDGGTVLLWAPPT